MTLTSPTSLPETPGLQLIYFMVQRLAHKAVQSGFDRAAPGCFLTTVIPGANVGLESESEKAFVFAQEIITLVYCFRASIFVISLV